VTVSVTQPGQRPLPYPMGAPTLLQWTPEELWEFIAEQRSRRLPPIPATPDRLKASVASTFLKSAKAGMNLHIKVELEYPQSYRPQTFTLFTPLPALDLRLKRSHNKADLHHQLTALEEHSDGTWLAYFSIVEPPPKREPKAKASKSKATDPQAQGEASDVSEA